MTLQILGLALYNRSRQRRDLKFRPGKVNVITGASKTGKTALIDIVDYCLGRLEYTVPEGRIRETVVWYALHVQLSSTQAVIGRPAPRGADTDSGVHLEVGDDLRLPEFGELRRMRNVDQLNDFLTEQVGIRGNEHVPADGHSRLPLRANIKHARLLLYQPMDRIASKSLMFYRQEEANGQMTQAIKDTLPYFLGATADDQLKRLQELRAARRDLRLLERRLADEEAIRGRDSSRAIALAEEAVNVGLTESSPATFEEAVDLLRGLAGWTPAAREAAPNDRLNELRSGHSALLAEHKSVQDEIRAARAFASAQDDYSHEAADQKDRLAAIGLYQHEPHENVCPLCESNLAASVPKADVLRRSLNDLERHIGSAYRQRPRLEAYLAEREAQLADLRQKITASKAAMDALVAQEEVLRRERDRTTEQARVVGRASLFVDSLNLIEDDALRRRVEAAKAKVKRLEEELSDDAVDDQLETRLRLIGGWMTQWARTLKVEHSDWPFEFDLKHLAVVAHRPSGPLRMLRMGSGENLLGCHLITHLALQKWFVENRRPVPSFLMFDQPTMVYYPDDDSREDRSVEDLKDEDRISVRTMFRLIFDIVEELKGGLQVIITDHANLKEDWFQEAVVDRWRDGRKLIPPSWYEQGPGPTQTGQSAS